MSISSDEINFLIYRYLVENGFAHSAFTFAYESLVIKSSVAQTEIPPGALITFLQKGLEYIAIEEHINEDGSIQQFENNFSLLSPLICEAVAVKEDRRQRRSVPVASAVNNTSAAISSNGSAPLGDTGSVPMDEVTDTNTSLAVGSAVETKDAVLKSETVSKLQLKSDASGSKVLQLHGHSGEVFMCLWSPIDRQLASGSADGMCRLWGLWEMSEDRWTAPESDLGLWTAVLPHSQTHGEKYKDVTSITWSPDGKFVATGCYDGMARIWSKEGALITLLKEHTGPVFSLKWCKSGENILSGSYDRRAIVWAASTGTMLKSFLLHSGPVLDVDWMDGDIFATCSSDKTIYVCQASSSELNTSLCTLRGHSDEVNAVCWSPGGTLLASCSDDSTAKVWTVKDGLKYDLRGHQKEIFTLRWTPTGEGSTNPDKSLCLCTASFDGTVKVWSGATGEMIFNLCKQVQPVYSLAPSPNGEYLATGSLGGNVSIWSLSTGSLLRETHGKGDTFDVSWSHDGGLLCSCFSSGLLYVLHTGNSFQDPKNVKELPTSQNEQSSTTVGIAAVASTTLATTTATASGTTTTSTTSASVTPVVSTPVVSTPVINTPVISAPSVTIPALTSNLMSSKTQSITTPSAPSIPTAPKTTLGQSTTSSIVNNTEKVSRPVITPTVPTVAILPTPAVVPTVPSQPSTSQSQPTIETTTEVAPSVALPVVATPVLSTSVDESQPMDEVDPTPPQPQ